MSAPEYFKEFCYDRIRLATRGYQEVSGEKVTLKELWKAYNRWKVTEKKPRIPMEDFTKLCEDTFGDSRGQHLYVHLRVFLDSEDVEEFDADHKKSLSNPLINPCTDAVPSEVMANHILNSENKMALVRGLVEDKRCLSSEIDELEKKVATLEKYEEQNNTFILHLIKRLAGIYRKADPSL